MPALMKTGLSARIVWMGLVADRAAALEAALVTSILARFSGPEGDAHGGVTRPSCSRVLGQYPRGTTIRNTRQFSILSAEDLASIAAEMGLETLDPALVGATVVVEGLPDFSHLPPSSRLQAPSGATLVVDMENRPCSLPARPIERRHPGKGKLFKAAAAGRRGVTAWVEAEGELRLGDVLTLHIPDQPVWSQLERVRAR
ncbi:MOSC domain-containing protein [Aliigemmobacter aestuarii]|uniref:MOSC domain-containing protein n=1 Tax=Aliigemmobacter aestuarii TaxID=1445661 RepID=A0A4S3MRF1_9RHOB|nr:MOSC domain-containing protein [Gemmobacter aestuarii]THD85017.1 MOSC domain-containing protein [Gemmobacter aestuarii]